MLWQLVGIQNFTSETAFLTIPTTNEYDETSIQLSLSLSFSLLHMFEFEQNFIGGMGHMSCLPSSPPKEKRPAHCTCAWRIRRIDSRYPLSPGVRNPFRRLPVSESVAATASSAVSGNSLDPSTASNRNAHSPCLSKRFATLSKRSRCRPRFRTTILSMKLVPLLLYLPTQILQKKRGGKNERKKQHHRLLNFQIYTGRIESGKILYYGR